MLSGCAGRHVAPHPRTTPEIPQALLQAVAVTRAPLGADRAATATELSAMANVTDTVTVMGD